MVSKITSVISLVLLLLSVSSCKKKVVKSKVKVYEEVKKNIDQDVDIFLPISEEQAKEFVGDPEECLLDNSEESERSNIFSKSEDFFELVRQEEAKLSDIPIPLGSIPIQKYFVADKNKVMLGYNCSMDACEIAKFYRHKMEYLGWESVSFFDGVEKLMTFKKSSRMCSVSVRQGSCKSRRSQEPSKIIIFNQV